MAELEDMINSVLSDPRQMDKIAGLAKSLMGGSDGPGPSAQTAPLPFDPGMLGRIQQLMGAGDADSSNQQALLRAMQPYLSPKRRDKMDKALKLARLAKLAGFAMEELGGDKND